MDATRTTVVRTTTLVNGMPLAAISAREEVPPCCVTVSAYTPAVKLLAAATLCQGYSSLWLDSEDATYMAALH